MSSDIKNKMLHWESNPPEGAWNRIASSLDADDEYVLSQKLSSFQSEPPGHIWENIEAGLETRKPGRIVSFYQTHKPAFKYGSAAAVLIFAIVLINLVVTRNTTSNELAYQPEVQNRQRQEAKSSPVTKDIPATENDTNERQNLTVQATTDFPSSGQKKETESKIPFEASPSKETGRRYDALVSGWKQAKDSLVNRYFVSTNSSGDAVKFSSKLHDLFDCSDEWTEAECAQQIKLWQRKAATSAMFASADFTGVLEILKGMQEGGK